MSARNKSYILLLIATLIWGIAGPVIKHTETYISPLVFLLYRMGISSVIGIVALSVTKRHNWPRDFQGKSNVLLYCFLATTVALGLLFLGYEKTSALTGSILNSVYPVLVAIVGMVFLHERITKRENVGMGIALLGTIIVTFEPFLKGDMASSSSALGNLLVIASVLVSVLVAVQTKVLLRHPINPASLTHLSFIIGFITLAPFVLYQFSFSQILQQIMNAPWHAHLGVLYMAILSGTVAYSVWNMGQKTIEIGESSLFIYAYPVITLPLAIFWLKEPITLGLVIGAIIITVGILVAELKSHNTKQRKKHRSS